MAQIAKSQASHPPARISQLLPTVKCSNCNVPVPLTELGDHICAPPPPLPSLPKPARSPTSTTALLPPRLQNLVPQSPRSPLASAPARAPARTPPQDPPKRRERPNPPPSPLSAGWTPRIPPVQDKPAPPPEQARKSPPAATRLATPVDNYARRSPSPASNARPPYESTVSTPSSYATAPEPDTKSGGEAGMAGVGRRGFAAAARAAMFAVANPGASRPNYAGGRDPDSAMPGMAGRRPHMPQYLDINTNVNEGSRAARTPPLSPNSGYSSHSPSPGPISPSPISPHGPQPSTSRSPSPPQGSPAPPAVSSRLPFSDRYKTTSSAGPDSAISDKNSTTQPLSTRTPASTPFLSRKPTFLSLSAKTTDSNMSGNSSSHYTSSATSATNILSKLEPSPLSPDSDYGGLPYADSDSEDDMASLKAKMPLTSSILRTPISGRGSMPFSSASEREARRAEREQEEKEKVRELEKQKEDEERERERERAKRDERERERMRERAKERDEKPSLGHARKMSASSSVASSSSSRGHVRGNSAAIAQALGLQSPTEQQGRYSGGPGNPARTRSKPSGSSSGRSISSAMSSRDRDRDRNRDRDRSGSSASASSSSYSRSTTRSGAERERMMQTLLEDETLSVAGSGSGATLSKSKSASAATSPVAESRAVKLPARSLTSPTYPKDSERDSKRTAAMAEPGVAAPHKRACVRCEKKIEDGRWVRVDAGGVLCEKCWKNMYLPKCRRCTLPIEKQAVSSSDGQLKGKYHRECFNCYKCNKPFPDKSFYVFDGQPFCAYHYHEANDSLCAAATCGQPIEGPCALSHAGDRYHPEHLLCEYTGYPRCRERLVEYYEVDGRMLCERHVGSVGGGAGGGSDPGGRMSAEQQRQFEEEEEENRQHFSSSSRAKKRMTRFIDLGGSDLR